MMMYKAVCAANKGNQELVDSPHKRKFDIWGVSQISEASCNLHRFRCWGSAIDGTPIYQHKKKMQFKMMLF